MTLPLPPALSAREVSAGYGATTILHGVNLEIPVGEFTVIVGPNGCGKSTLLKTLARVITPRSGEVLLEGTPIRAQRSRHVATRLGFLAQSPQAPPAITVGELVARGRHPHRSLLTQWSAIDDAAIAHALELTGLTDRQKTPIAALSGGQRQRAWVAMVLAQDTPIILLDEPTTFLDIAHQYDQLELFKALHRDGRTVVAVLHDLGQAARFADRLVLMKAGRVHSSGTPAEILTAQNLAEVFGLDAVVAPDPLTGTPLVIPRPATPSAPSTAADIIGDSRS